MTNQPAGSSTATPTRAAFGFILITVILDTLAFGVMAPVLPKLLVTLQGGDTAAAATTLGIFGTIWAVMQFLASPVQGSLSDRFGRRPVILISLFGLGLDYVLMALAPNIMWLFIGRVLSGIAGANYATVTAYIADTTPPDERAKRFGWVGAAWGFGFVVGPAFGGFLAQFDLRLPFWVAAGLCMVNALYGLFILPESLPKERRSPFHWKSANFFGSLKMLRSMPALFALALALFFVRLGHDVNPSIAVIYAQYRYDWSELQVGYMLAVVGVCSMIAQAVLVGPVVKKLGERGALTAGLIFGTVSFLFYASAPIGWLFIAGIPFGALFGMAGPAMQGLATRSVGSSDQGKLQGALASVVSIGTMIAPVLFAQTFAMGISQDGPQVPGLPYYIAALMLIAALVLARRAERHTPVAP
jgi:DHA1 family tetracycline resistance protein-like MFS transporter